MAAYNTTTKTFVDGQPLAAADLSAFMTDIVAAEMAAANAAIATAVSGLSTPVASSTVVGGIKSGGEITVGSGGTATVVGVAPSANPFSAYSGTTITYGAQSGVDGNYTGAQLLAWVQSNLTSGASYVLPAATTSVRGGFKPDGVTITMTGDVGSVAGQDPSALSAAGALSLTDGLPMFRTGASYQTTMAGISTLVRKTPAGSRTAALPAVLTASDHDKNVTLTGTTGNLSADGTVGDGFRCNIINLATGTANYSGITGLLGTTSLGSGAATTVLMIGSTIYATASSTTTVSTATTYTASLSASSGGPSATVTMTLTPTAGAWPAGDVITPTATTLAGTFAPTTITLTASTASVSFVFTPSSSAGTSGTLSSSATTTTGGALSNTTGGLAYAISVVTATSFTTTLSSSSGTVGAAPTMTITPNGNWPASALLTPNQSVAIGTYSPTTISPTAGGSTPAVFTLTTSGAGTSSLSVAETGSSPLLTNTTGSLTYTATAASSSLPTVGGASPGLRINAGDMSTLFATTDTTGTGTLATSDGTSVLGIKDAASSGIVLNQATSSAAPTLVLSAQNGKAGLQFDNANSQFMAAVAGTALNSFATAMKGTTTDGTTGSWTCLVVIRPNDTRSGGYNIWDVGFSTDVGFLYGNANIQIGSASAGGVGVSPTAKRYTANSGASVSVTDGSVNRYNACLKMVVRFDDATGTMYIQAMQPGSTTTASAEVSAANSAITASTTQRSAWDTFRIGKGPTTFFPKYMLHELVFYPGKFASTAERDALLAYANSVWGA